MNDSVGLTTVIVEHYDTDYKSKTAQEEHWSCRSKEKTDRIINYRPA